LLHWQQEHWVVVYALKGDRLIIANPLNPSQNCESLPNQRLMLLGMGNCGRTDPARGQIQPQLVLASRLRYRRLLGEVLFASSHCSYWD